MSDKPTGPEGSEIVEEITTVMPGQPLPAEALKGPDDEVTVVDDDAHSRATRTSFSDEELTAVRAPVPTLELSEMNDEMFKTSTVKKLFHWAVIAHAGSEKGYVGGLNLRHLLEQIKKRASDHVQFDKYIEDLLNGIRKGKFKEEDVEFTTAEFVEGFQRWAFYHAEFSGTPKEGQTMEDVRKAKRDQTWIIVNDLLDNNVFGEDRLEAIQLVSEGLFSEIVTEILAEMYQKAKGASIRPKAIQGETENAVIDQIDSIEVKETLYPYPAVIMMDEVGDVIGVYPCIEPKDCLVTIGSGDSDTIQLPKNGTFKPHHAEVTFENGEAIVSAGPHQAITMKTDSGSQFISNNYREPAENRTYIIGGSGTFAYFKASAEHNFKAKEIAKNLEDRIQKLQARLEKPDADEKSCQLVQRETTELLKSMEIFYAAQDFEEVIQKAQNLLTTASAKVLRVRAENIAAMENTRLAHFNHFDASAGETMDTPREFKYMVHLDPATQDAFGKPKIHVIFPPSFIATHEGEGNGFSFEASHEFTFNALRPYALEALTRVNKVLIPLEGTTDENLEINAQAVLSHLIEKGLVSDEEISTSEYERTSEKFTFLAKTTLATIEENNQNFGNEQSMAAGKAGLSYDADLFLKAYALSNHPQVQWEKMGIDREEYLEKLDEGSEIRLLSYNTKLLSIRKKLQEHEDVDPKPDVYNARKIAFRMILVEMVSLTKLRQTMELPTTNYENDWQNGALGKDENKVAAEIISAQNLMNRISQGDFTVEEVQNLFFTVEKKEVKDFMSVDQHRRAASMVKFVCGKLQFAALTIGEKIKSGELENENLNKNILLLQQLMKAGLITLSDTGMSQEDWDESEEWQKSFQPKATTSSQPAPAPTEPTTDITKTTPTEKIGQPAERLALLQEARDADVYDILPFIKIQRYNKQNPDFAPQENELDKKFVIEYSNLLKEKLSTLVSEVMNKGGDPELMKTAIKGLRKYGYEGILKECVGGMITKFVKVVYDKPEQIFAVQRVLEAMRLINLEDLMNQVQANIVSDFALQLFTDNQPEDRKAAFRENMKKLGLYK